MQYKKIIIALLLALPVVASALPTTRYEQHIYPFTDSAYDLGTSTNAWSGGTFDKLCLTADICRTTWPGSGGFAWPFTKQGGGEQATSTILGTYGGLLSLSSTTLVGDFTVPALTSAITLTGAGGLFAEYAGTTCTNQFVRALSALGVATCATVTSTDVDSSITPSARTITIAGTAGQITSSAGAQDLSANRTWTLSIPALFNIGRATTTEFSAGTAFFGRTATTTINGTGDLYVNGSTTLQTATSTSLGTITLCLSTDCRTAWPTAAAGLPWPFTKQAGGEQATTTIIGLYNGFLSRASSTVDSTFLVTGSSTLQTTAITALRNLTSNGFLKTGGGIGTLSVDTTTYLSSIGAGTNGQLAYWGGSNTLVGTATSSATCSGIVSCSGFTVVGSVSPTIAGTMSFAFPYTKQGNNNLATSTIINFLGGMTSMASSTMSSLVATSTNFNVSANAITFGSNYVNATVTPSFMTSSSSAMNTLEKRGFGAGTSTIYLANYPERRVINNVRCYATSTAAGGGGFLLRFRAGDTFSSTFFCDTSNRQISVAFSVPPFTSLYAVRGPASTTVDIGGGTLDVNKVSN
jgi:hypothetical protein